ncbi:chromosome segregation protein SMC [bacterium]|nr:chromosome segregation protein SMC [bacterium]RQV99165.1 MAG: chromosome segregation protein SMC [bacterium]
MVLSKISLHGFKSFAKKVDLHFDGRITAIVGPNGCGKTNIVDSIRWGLGEQKTSVLRADRMENVIFGGAQSSRPLGMAEVSVHFDNSKHLLPIDYTEVVVTRRLYRSGESEYILNKNTVRLKDIQDLFMDTGIGADAYSVIELKMVEDILSEKAEDRRRLLEEAAGVTKYKHRLKAAARKLDATHHDLLRVNDIVQEVGRNVSSLKRQVQRAKRYLDLQEKIKSLELKRGCQLYTRLQEEIKPLREKLKMYQSQKEGRTTEITKEEADLESFRLNLVESEKALTQVREELNAVIEQLHRCESDIRVGKERVASLKELIVRHYQEIETLTKRLDEQKIHLDVAIQNREALQVKITSSGRLFNNKSKELEVFQQGLNLKRLELNNRKKEIINCLEKNNQLSNEEIVIRAKIDNNQGRLERLDDEDAIYREVQKKTQEIQKRLDHTLQRHRSERQAIIKKKEEIETHIEKVQNSIASAKEAVYRDQSLLELQHGRLLFLKKVIENHEDTTDGAKKLLKLKPEGLLGVLVDLFETAPKYRNALEIGLGDAANYLLFEKRAQAFHAIQLLRDRGGGKVTLVSVDRMKRIANTQKRFPLPEKFDFIGWGDDLVQCDDRFRSIMTYLLGDLLIVQDLNTAQKAIDHISDGQVRLATLQGELVTKWGVFQAGSDSGDDHQRVGRLQRMHELEENVKQLQESKAVSEKQLTHYENRFQTLSEEKVGLQTRLTDIEETINKTEKEQAKINFEWEKAGESIHKNVDERKKLLIEIEKAKDILENIHPQIETLLEKREQIEAISGQIQAEVDRLENEEKLKEEEVHRLNLSVVRLKGEAGTLDYNIERSQGLIEDLQTTITERKNEIDSSKEQIERYEKETVQNEKILTEHFAMKGKVESQLREQEEIYRKLSEDIQMHEREVSRVRRDRDRASEDVHQLAMEISDLEHQEESIKDRLWESYGIKLKKITLEDKIDMNESEREIDNLKQKIKALGPVNMLALQEFEESKERLDFLNRQRTDLLQAEETLNETILKINRTARQRFVDVFAQVRENFKETFGRFFQGGEADLRLIEGEDPLEAQIEIIARPAGKHFRDLDLLSGGERALTAISLLFALYLVKPSPFCILDEIDAPLDDANVNRFTRVLQEYAQKTQFIIVTHNKVTMKVAQALYGVTMEEEGVSRIVSVKFEDDEENAA